MAHRTLPETDHDILISMWTLLVGTNGEGLLGKFESFSEETRKRLSYLDAQLPLMWTRAEHLKAEKEAAECAEGQRDRRKISLREWVMIVLTTISVMTVLSEKLVNLMK